MYHIIFLKIIIFQSIITKRKSEINNKINNKTLNNILFDSIKGDFYNLTTIFLYNYTNIKIKRQALNKNNSLVCVFGILVNYNGLKIEKEMTDWLLPEYEVYKIYQKYPGRLYEYPALRFAQWLTEKKNISFILYLHTKGATHKEMMGGLAILRKFWKNEFTKPRNKIYISNIVNNVADITTPLSNKAITWYNGMYISRRAFQLRFIQPSKNRFIYEFYFSNPSIRIKGIVAENCKWPLSYLNAFNKNINSSQIRNKELKKIVFLGQNNKIKEIDNIILIFYLLFVCSIKFSINIWKKTYRKRIIRNVNLIKNLEVDDSKNKIIIKFY